VKNIEVRRASVEQIDFLLKHDIVRTGTRSITFISLDQSISFLSDELRKLEKKRQKGSTMVVPGNKISALQQRRQQHKNLRPSLPSSPIRSAPSSPTQSMQNPSASLTASTPAMSPESQPFIKLEHSSTSPFSVVKIESSPPPPNNPLNYPQYFTYSQESSRNPGHIEMHGTSFSPFGAFNQKGYIAAPFSIPAQMFGQYIGTEDHEQWYV